MRANHHLLSNHIANFDYQQPLKLESTQKWEGENIHLFHIVNDIVQLFPCENPFKINESFFKELSPRESVLYSAAMIHFLLIVIDEYPSYKNHIEADLKFLHSYHFEKLLFRGIPISREDSKTESIRA
eukprot:NODE_323_length_9725_cov_0.840536.p12 type:complete len:128 gc:universal NODE_323_length_9725_cov_0.840536:7815-7432(-)